MDGTEKSSGLCTDGRGLVSKCHSSLEGFILLTCGDAGKRSGKPQIKASPHSSHPALALGGAKHEPASSSYFNSKSIILILWEGHELCWSPSPSLPAKGNVLGSVKSQQDRVSYLGSGWRVRSCSVWVLLQFGCPTHPCSCL